MLNAQAQLSHVPSQEARTSVTGNPGDVSSYSMDLRRDGAGGVKDEARIT